MISKMQLKLVAEKAELSLAAQVRADAEHEIEVQLEL